MSKELIDNVAERIGISKKETKEFVDVLLEEIKDSLFEGNDVVFQSFGKFSVTKRAARKGRNPATGAIINIPASQGVVFKTSSVFKAQMNRK